MPVSNFKQFLKSLPRFTRLGLFLPIVNLTWLYPWKRQGGFVLYDNSSKQYISERTFRLTGYFSAQKLVGMSYESWVEKTCSLLPENTIVLLDIDVLKKPPGFWNTMPTNIRRYFHEDLVILKTQTYDEAYKIWSTLDTEFCQALLIGDGVVINNRRENGLR